MSLRILFYDDIGAIPQDIYELKQVSFESYMMCDGPVSVHGYLNDYEKDKKCYLCYLYDKITKEEQEKYKNKLITLEDNKDGTYSFVNEENVKISKVKKKI